MVTEANRKQSNSAQYFCAGEETQWSALMQRRFLSTYRAHSVDFVFFLFSTLVVWGEVAVVHFLMSGKRLTLKGSVPGLGCLSICWLLGYLPFRSIWELLGEKRRAIQEHSPHSSTEDSPGVDVAPSEDLVES